MAAADELATIVISEARAEHDGDLGLQTGVQLGRYIVLGYIGKGANGEVYAAYDPELDRRVALKLLRRQSVHGSRALVQEAQAMAKLTHPNVVAVHDVGSVVLGDDETPRLFIAMQYVPGGTLRDWWSERERSYEEIIALFIQAGRGLAAAHAQGLVHRDFKPDNVLVGEDGRVRVTDFGLARTQHELSLAGDESSTTDEPAADPSLGVLPRSRWRGTPAYMAAEQFLGGTVDHLTDQFAFCVCLFEALYGVRPFIGETPLEVARSVCVGEVFKPQDAKPVPRRIVDAVMRGLSRERERRFPNMYALLDGLDPPPHRRRIIGAAVGSGLLVGALVLLATRQPTAEDPCVDAGQEIDALWSPERHVALTRAITATQVPGAEDTAALVTAELDVYAHQLHTASVRSCTEQAAAVDVREYDRRRVRCLERRFDLFAARVEVMASIAPEQVENLVAVVSDMPAVSDCEDLEALSRMRYIDRDRDANISGFAHQLERISTMEASGAFGRAQSLLDVVAEPILATGDVHLIADLEYERGRLAMTQHQGERAEAAYRRAYFGALEAGDDDTASSAALSLAHTLSTDLGRFDEAREWIQHGRALALRSGEHDHMGPAYDTAGFVAYRSGDLELALDQFQRARAEFLAGYGPESLQVGRAEINLAAILLAMHRWEDSVPHHRAGQAILEAKLGPTHVDNVTAHLNYGLTLTQLNRLDEARAELGAAWKLLERRDQSADDFIRALVHNGLGEIDSRVGDWQSAADHFAAMHEIMLALLGEQNTYTADAAVAHAGAWVRLGRVDEGVAELERALASLTEHEANAEELANAEAELAIGLWTRGDARERATALMNTALERFAGADIEVPVTISRWLREQAWPGYQ